MNERRDELGRFAPGHLGWTREEALEAVRDFAERKGYQPVLREARRRHGLPNTSAVRRLFGSWNEMIAAAGFEPYPARSSAKAKALARRDRLNKTDGFSTMAITEAR